MKWDRLGLVFAARGKFNWAVSYALQPTPLGLADRIRVFAGMRDLDGVSRVGWVDLDLTDPTKVLGCSALPSLDTGAPGAFDEFGVVPSIVFFEGSRIYLYYAGYQRGLKARFLVFGGLAVSDDLGVSFWRIRRTPIFERTDDDLLFRVPHCLIRDGKYRFWYGGGDHFESGSEKSLLGYDIRYLESNSLLEMPSRGTVSVTMGISEYRLGRPRVIRRNDGYLMFYGFSTHSCPYQLGVARSPDGLAWSRCDADLGLPLAASGWDSEMMTYPAFFEADCKSYLLYDGKGVWRGWIRACQACELVARRVVQSDMRVEPYVRDRVDEWDDLVRLARNSTFLHSRSFMEYHSHRFQDASVFVVDDGGPPIAAFPANRDGDTVVSDGGLTYGALLMPPSMTQAECLRAFDALASHYRAQGISRILYKPVPHVFHRSPAEEDLYALFRNGASLKRREPSAVIELSSRLPFATLRKRSVKKAKKFGLELLEGGDYEEFHTLLSGVLERHGTTPVHSVAELRLLASRFPRGIRLFQARSGSSLPAAVLVFDFGHVVHTQYLSCSPAGREVCALDLLIDQLLTTIFADRRYVILGIPTEQQGRYLNEGLQRQKEGFGARSAVHDLYEWLL